MLCEVCYKDATRVCSACKYTRYCSEACQKANWKIPKKGCEIQQMLNRMSDEHAAALRLRPNPKRYTGCNVKFTEDYPCDDECPHCRYVACESCICDNKNGTCDCPNSNFGNKYCQMEPRYVHTDSNSRGYEGNRHPELFPYEMYTMDFYEAEPRACNNSGEVTKLLKEYCREIRSQ